MRILLCCLITVLFCRTASAQEEIITPSRFVARVPFQQFIGGIIIFQAQLGSFPDTLNFILDSGSGGISLDSTTALSFGLKPVLSDKYIRGIGGIKKVSFLNAQKMKLPGHSVDNLDFFVNDYTLLTSVYGERIDGVVGYSLLSRYIVKINYDSSYFDLWTKGSFKYPRGGYMLRPRIASLPVQTLRVKDERVVNARFLYDLGAGLNLILSTDFIQDSSFLKKKRKLYPKYAEGLGGKVDMSMTVIRELRLGPFRFKQVPVYVFDDKYNVTNYPNLGGLIGSDILRRFNSILNYAKEEFYLIPNAHYDDNFDYSYHGIELYYINGMIVVGDIAKNSPAEKAGLKEGDVVVAINTDFTQNLSRYKALLQMVHTRVDFLIRRGTELMKIGVNIKSIE